MIDSYYQPIQFCCKHCGYTGVSSSESKEDDAGSGK